MEHPLEEFLLPVEGGLHQLSWFQFLPHESEFAALDKSVRGEQKDGATFMVLSAHLQLQKEGFLSTWTNSFVGPWDPSQGLHNPDEKIKLWLFLPGRHSSVVDSVQPSVSKLRVVASGLWLAPGDSEEVGAALSQALRNCIERSLIGTYVRFGDVFSRYGQFSQDEELLRKGQPTVEFVFAATEEAIFVHVVISAKLIRGLSTADMERLLKHPFNNINEKLPVIVSPNGMRGRLAGCCSSDLVKQVYLSSGKSRGLNGFLGLPNHVSYGSSCQLRGQSYYAEVTLGYPGGGNDCNLLSDSVSNRNFSKHRSAECPALRLCLSLFYKLLFWLQNWIGPALSCSSFFMNRNDGITDSLDGSVIEPNGLCTQHAYNSSSNSNSSSIGSISSSSSDSDYNMITGAGDFEADADSVTCRQSGLSSNDQLDNHGPKPGSKRPRVTMTESFNQVGTVINAPMQDACRSDYGSFEANNSAITGVANEQLGSHWDWDDDRGIGTDIQALLSEFGDFGDFFESDTLPFGEPPGTAESQVLIFPAQDCGDVGSSPCTGVMDISEQMLLPVGYPSSECLNPPPPISRESSPGKNQEVTNNTSAYGSAVYTTASSTGEFDHLIKAEALMTFAPEYGAVETPTSEFSSSVFKSPYLPKSWKEETPNSSPNLYKYGATPPSSPCLDISDEKPAMALNSKLSSAKHDANAVLQSKKCYTHVDGMKGQANRRLSMPNDNSVQCERVSTTPFNALNATNAAKSMEWKIPGGTVDSGHLLRSMKTVIATEIDCILFQAFMCKIRHTLLSFSSPKSIGLSRLTIGAVSNQLPGDVSTMTDCLTSKFEVKKKEIIPVRVAGDIDGGMLDGSLNAPVGVWRSVGAPKGAKPSTSPIDVLPHNSFTEEAVLHYGQRQPLHELLDGMAFLVQQATSSVDIALDAECGDGPYSWLALQEQWRRGFPCGPSMVHAGCGGTLASCHSLDVAGVELPDLLSADVPASSVISLLQSDMKTALKSAFASLDGPLSVIDWCKGRGQSGDVGISADGLSAESGLSEFRDSSNSVTPSVGEPISPSQSSASGSSSLKVSSSTDGGRTEETCQKRSSQEISSSDLEQLQGRLRPSLFVLPLPAILVGYQDDWLKTSANSLQLWEKAPLEPYAMPKPMTYHVICPDIDPLTNAATDFFQQLGTVYETCKLGTHSPQTIGNQMEMDSGKLSSSGFVLLDCPQSMKIESCNASLVGSISDYFLSLSNGWDLKSFLKSLSKVLRALKITSCMTTNPKEGTSSPCTVIYVVCPFPEPVAVLQTVIQSAVAIGSTILSSDKDRRSLLYSQVGKALSGSAAVDEASTSNILTLSGFSVPRLVLQIVTVDVIFRVTSPAHNELVILKETAFTVYNKARRISRGFANDWMQSSSLPGRSHSLLMQMPSPVPGLWKDCVAPRITGSSLTREGELDASLRAGSWDSSWQTPRAGGLTCDSSRVIDFHLQDEIRYMYEPLFILADTGSVESGVSPLVGSLGLESSKQLSDDSSTGVFMQTSGSTGVDAGPSPQLDGSDPDGFGHGIQKTVPSLHCCYGWTEDWRWLVCVWTDSRGELLDSNIFPFGGISSRQDTKGLQCLFVQVLQQGCQILQACTTDSGVARPRDIVITRIGCFYELECQEWQKAIYSVGGSEVKKWPLQLRRAVPDGLTGSSNGTSLQQQEMGMIQERNLPSSPSSLYSPHSKVTGYMKGSLGQSSTRKQLMAGGHSVVDASRGLLQWVQSITFVGISIDHSLHLVLQADLLSPGGTQGSGTMGSSPYVEGYTPVKSLGSSSAAYILIPSPSLRFLPPLPLQLPTCLTAESPPLAHLLHSKGSAVPLSTGFVVSKAVPSMRKDSRSYTKDEWPSVISVSLVDYYGGNNVAQEKVTRGMAKQGGRNSSLEARDFEIETHLILESVAAELHALSWMTVSPAYLERRTALPFHCDMVLRLRRLLHYADRELSQQPEK
ncbi:MID domain of medPIWI [Dillenia turbinata]|uniref:Mediator of RNA polymerase II transcription subunit 13 n=1 Tax=Dillenia turbinata TaxID=194707 RepID=A0AAN8Z5M8_9MAGN